MNLLSESGRAAVVRVAPQPTLASQGFWTSGADGRLRITTCMACRARVHPPQPICPECRGRDLELAEVSGRATVAGFTVNEQEWSPTFPPPYVVAVVELADAPGVRLTTNIVGCEPSDVHIGMPVSVLFEQVEDVWLPLFEPASTGADVRVTEPDPRDVRAGLRMPATTRKYEDAVAITGVGKSRIGRRLMVDPLSLTVDAALEAVADAGLTLSDIDGLSTYPGGWMPGMSEGGASALEEALRIRPVWVNGASETPGQFGSITAAMLAVASGLCRHVLCFRTVWESSHATMVRSGRWPVSPSRATGMVEYLAPFGAYSPANWIACQASHYMHRYGANRDVLGWIAVVERLGAARNPDAIYRDPLSIEDYRAARIISTPFGLYDCDVPVDGAVAVIVSAAETACDRPRPPVLVEACGTQILERLSWDQGTLTHLPQALGPAAHLWTRTALTPSDVDVALLYDGFTFNALSWLEALGFCGFGEATDFIDEGRGIALGGALPLNPHGGQLSAGRLHGYGLLHEGVQQLRGIADGRQVADAKVAVVTNGGGVPSGAMLLRAD